MDCTQCGVRSDRLDKFCGNCGTRIAIPEYTQQENENKKARTDPQQSQEQAPAKSTGNGGTRDERRLLAEACRTRAFRKRRLFEAS